MKIRPNTLKIRGSRPNGPSTSQPKATPWVTPKTRQSPEGAKHSPQHAILTLFGGLYNTVRPTHLTLENTLNHANTRLP